MLDASGNVRAGDIALGVDTGSQQFRMLEALAGTLAVPVGGGPPRRICSGGPHNWVPDGRYLYLGVQPFSLSGPGKTRVIALRPGEMLPKRRPSESCAQPTTIRPCSPGRA